jgi:hypothetical protein
MTWQQTKARPTTPLRTELSPFATSRERQRYQSRHTQNDLHLCMMTHRRPRGVQLSLTFNASTFFGFCGAAASKNSTTSAGNPTVPPATSVSPAASRSRAYSTRCATGQLNWRNLTTHRGRLASIAFAFTSASSGSCRSSHSLG